MLKKETMGSQRACWKTHLIFIALISSHLIDSIMWTDDLTSWRFVREALKDGPSMPSSSHLLGRGTERPGPDSRQFTRRRSISINAVGRPSCRSCDPRSWRHGRPMKMMKLFSNCLSDEELGRIH